MSNYKMNLIRAKALQSGVRNENTKSIADKVKELKPFAEAEVIGRPNAQYDNKKQRGWGIK
jgi:hypothetical protein